MYSLARRWMKRILPAPHSRSCRAMIWRFVVVSRRNTDGTSSLTSVYSIRGFHKPALTRLLSIVFCTVANADIVDTSSIVLVSFQSHLLNYRLPMSSDFPSHRRSLSTSSSSARSADPSSSCEPFAVTQFQRLNSSVQSTCPSTSSPNSHEHDQVQSPPAGQSTEEMSRSSRASHNHGDELVVREGTDGGRRRSSSSECAVRRGG